jgi:hypothetical protein
MMKQIITILTLVLFFAINIKAQCWFVDDSTDSVCQTDPSDSCIPITYPDGTPAQFIEALSIDPSGSPVYASDGGQVGILDPNTGIFTPFANPSGYGDIDGLAWDPNSNKLYASIRSGGNDELVCIETSGPNAGLPLPGTEVEVTGSGPDIDELTVPPNTCSNAGLLYATISTASGFVLATIDPVSGIATEIGPFGIPDVESITFDANCNLYANNGGGDLYLVDQITGAVIGDPILSVNGNDVEGMSCEDSTPFGASISNYIWEDINGDGVQDAGENGIAGILVNLLDDMGNPVLDPAGNPITATTDANGEYLFDNLPAGDYTVVIDPSNFSAGGALEDYTQTFDEDGGDDGSIDVSLDSNEDHITADFGYAPLGSIGDTIFEDLDGDGVQGPGEMGIPGVTVELFDDMGNSLGTVVTDANGEYIFEDLPAGDYTVEVTPPADFENTADPDGTMDNTTTVTLGAGETIMHLDFGYDQIVVAVDILYFTAEKVNNEVLLKWELAYDRDLDIVEIQHSTDGSNFSTIKTGSRNLISYSDQNAVSGSNYYRLRFVEYNGELTISNIKVVSFLRGENVKVYPTLVSGQLNIEGTEIVQYSIFDLSGKLVQKSSTDEVGHEKIDMSEIQTGNYIIRLESESGQIHSKRFVRIQ